MVARIAVAPTKLPRAAIEYPESDGRPMAETDWHADTLIYLREALRDFFRAHSQVYVAGNLLIYYNQDDPTTSVAPDVFVVLGVPAHERRVYKVWEEGQAPDVVIELTSKATRQTDLWFKRGLYQDLGVREYFVFDPLHEYLTPVLQGYQLEADSYVRMSGTGQALPCLKSKVLGLELRVEPAGERLRLRLYDPARGEALLSPLEAQAARRAAEEQVTRLRAELARLREE